MVDKTTRHLRQIADYPFSGRKVPEYGAQNSREIIEPPYRFICKIEPNQMDVLAVVHGARLVPDDVYNLESESP